MMLKITYLIVFIVAEIGLGIYSMWFSDELWSRFLFFIVSAIIIGMVAVKLCNRLMPYEDQENQQLPNQD